MTNSAWPDDLITEITAYAESLGIASPEVDVSNYWRASEGTVIISAPTPAGGAWASQDYLLRGDMSRDAIQPVIIKAGKAAAEHLLQFVATKH